MTFTTETESRSGRRGPDVLVLAALLAAAPACITRQSTPAGSPSAAAGAPSSATAAAPAPAGGATPAQPAAAEPTPAPHAALAREKREQVLGPNAIKDFAVHGEKHKADVSFIKVTGQPFSDALRAEVKEGSSHEYAVQVQTKNVAPVKEKDVLLATFYIRSAKAQEDGPAETQFVFELGRSPYSKSVTYSVKAAPEWVKVQVPFGCAQNFAAGEASAIFRLGYEPQVIEIGGVTLENFGRFVARNSFPSTAAADEKRLMAAAGAGVLPPVDAGPFRVTVTPGKVVRPISPYVYGVNSHPSEGVHPTARRMGGNRQTAYNWEINASNAGNDWRHSNDDWPCTALGYTNCNEPGAQFTEFHKQNKKLGAETVATIPLIDFVSADKSKDVAPEDKAPSKRWLRSQPQKDLKKDGAYAYPPNLTDGVVYQDEFVSHLVKALGKASAGGIRFYSLDNEPALWPSTHPRVHPEKTKYEEMVTRTEAIAVPLTKLDPSAELLGAVAYGWTEFITLQGAPEAQEMNAVHGSYLEYFLASMKRLEDKHKRRLVHVLDVHWYPEQRGARRITDPDVTRKTIAARLEAPRSFWDPTYLEKTFIGAEWKKPVRLIPWLRELVDKRYPGTKLSMTEYNFGAGDHISGGLAQADVLGIFGREGMYLANYWGNGPGNDDLPSYIAAAFRLYRNYDGKRATYGDTAVTATVADHTKASVYAATDSKRGKLLHILVINKDQQARWKGEVVIEGAAKYTKAATYVLDGSSPQIRPGPAVEIKSNRIEHPLPPLSATLFVCER
jgi:hypothetical protein